MGNIDFYEMSLESPAVIVRAKGEMRKKELFKTILGQRGKGVMKQGVSTNFLLPNYLNSFRSAAFF